jgi:thioredoxin reductase (NADPH)
VRWRNRSTGSEDERPIRNVFLFVGADPATEWLAGCGVALDDKGFVKTGAALSAEELRVAHEKFPGRVPAPLETNLPGVFAVGDVRSGSVKRVGGAIGEGAAVVAQVHAFLSHA